MKVFKVSHSQGVLQARYSLSPRGILRFAVSVPRGTYGEGSGPLDIRSEIQQAQGPRCDWPARTRLKPGWGLISETKPLSYKSRRTISETLAAMDREYGGKGEKLRIVTFTLPSVSVRAYQALAAWASYSLNRLNTWLERALGEHARCGVWEWQKRGALHYHCVIGTHALEKYKGFARAIKGQWITILRDIQERTGANMFLGRKGQDHRKNAKNIQVDCQIIKKSVAAYLSKYLSKGEGEKSRDGATNKDAWQAKKAGCFYAPPRWANYNRIATSLRNKFSRGGILCEFSGQFVPKILCVLKEFSEMTQAPGTKIIETEGIGYAANCMYAIVGSWNHCMDAMGFLRDSLAKIVPCKDWLSVQPREIEEKPPFDEIAWEQQLKHREALMQKQRTFPELYRRKPSEHSAWDRLKWNYRREVVRAYARRGQAPPPLKEEKWDRKYWNSCDKNGIVGPINSLVKN